MATVKVRLSWRATARSTGCAGRGSIPERCSHPCSARRKTGIGACRQPEGPQQKRRYRDGALILETDFETANGGRYPRRLHAFSPGRPEPADPPCPGPLRRGRNDDRIHAALRLRPDRSLGHPNGRRRAAGDRGAGHGCFADECVREGVRNEALRGHSRSGRGKRSGLS